MDKKEILAFINANPIAFLATAEDNKPHVRAMGTYSADENGIIFSMQSPKDVYKQLVKNPEIEACYWAKDIQIRVRGKVQQITDMAVKKEIVEKRPFYKPGVETDGWDYVGAFILKHGKATVLDMKGPPTPPGVSKVWVEL
ncbi:MAG: pyridoxamine 5'-phosphate oxidase family protein [Dehalococcoidales bacterium]